MSAKKNRQSKAQRMQKVVAAAAAKEPEFVTEVDNPSTITSENPEMATVKAEDQKTVVEAKVGDQKDGATTTPAQATPEGKKPEDKPKRKKKLSATHVAWVAQEDLPKAGVIHITDKGKGNPKRGYSAERYALHEDGITVQQYMDKSVKAGNSARLAMMDVRWDVTKGFITVTAPPVAPAPEEPKEQTPAPAEKASEKKEKAKASK